MGVTSDIKLEIAKKNTYKKETKSFLQGVFVASGSLIVSSGNLSFSISLDSENLSIVVNQKLCELFPEMEFKIAKIVRSFRNKEKFEISPISDGDKVLKELGIISYDKDNNLQISEVCDRSYFKNVETMKAFLTGAFIGAGSISIPTQSTEKKGYGYHFEIDVQTKIQADLIAEMFSSFDIFPKIVERSDMFIVYLKNSETICDVLSLFGASKAVLDLMNKKVDRDMNNMTNRQVNCITANLDKTINAALKQIQAIEVIQNTIGIESLPETLCEAALLRLSNPEASLSDLLPLMETKVSKGALAQRFDKIIKISKELGE